MDEKKINDPILDMFIFETIQQLEQLEIEVLSSEKENSFAASMNEIFRIMHTLKGNSAMMLFDNISKLAHSVEDLFDYLRHAPGINADCSKIADIVLSSLDYIKNEVGKIKDGESNDVDSSYLVQGIKQYLSYLKSNNPSDTTGATLTPSKSEPAKFYITSNKVAEEDAKQSNNYKALIYFMDGCEMENVRAFALLHNITDVALEGVKFYPPDVVENDASSETIIKEGFRLVFTSKLGLEEIKAIISKTAFIKTLELSILESQQEELVFLKIEAPPKSIILESDNMGTVTEPTVALSSLNMNATFNQTISTTPNVLSVNISKLDMLMDLVGELVISESMVTNNPELQGLHLDNFFKASRQLRKIINDVQDVVMSIRMVSLAPTFQKMNRLVRDISKKLLKEVELEIIGQDTEVDKNIIEHIADPLVHIIRNSLDHGIECAEDRIHKGKSKVGKIILEAKNEGGEVWITVKDDGAGLNKEKILKKAREHGLISKSESELSEKEIYSFILLPGFSTNEAVTEFSGRGVGMDVVLQNVEKIRGTISVDSVLNVGTTMSIKIPLTLAIIDGMNIKVGNARYTIPITSIKESFRIGKKDLIKDLSGNEMILLRGECHPVIRLHELYNVKNAKTEIEQGILILVQVDTKTVCIFVDGLLGQQQVVVKALPSYIKKVKGIAGCTLLGDGSISLILDTSGIVSVTN